MTTTTPTAADRVKASMSTPRAARIAAGVAGVVVFWLCTATGLLYLDNTYGPFEDHGGRGALLALAIGLASGAAALGLTLAIARWSRLAMVVLVGVVCVAAWVLQPRPVDVSESFVPQSNPRWSCSGWSFDHYPPGVMDGSATRYCVGLEHRIADG